MQDEPPHVSRRLLACNNLQKIIDTEWVQDVKFPGVVVRLVPIDRLRYYRFHTTALCSPTRQALLTGRNHHSAGMGCITELATSVPGYSSARPKNKAPLAMTRQ